MAGQHADEDRVSAARLEAEQQFYRRFFKFLLVVTCFFGVVFFSELQHSRVLFFVGIAGFGVYLLYMIGLLAYTVFVVNPRNDLSHILTQAELTGIDHNDSDEEQEAISAERMAMCPLEETPQLVRSCRQEVTYYRPKSGRYSVVYNAVYFGKSIRSESELQLKFEESSTSNGWEITGTILSGSKRTDSQTKRSIAEGFINARGEMYWKLANPRNDTHLDGTYRGLYDFRSSALYDGDFCAGAAPPGRIVRMELLEEAREEHHASNNQVGDCGSPDLDNWGAHDVEMVEIDKSLV